MSTLIAVISFVVILAIPVGAIIHTFRPTKGDVEHIVEQSLAFDPRHPDVSYR